MGSSIRRSLNSGAADEKITLDLDVQHSSRSMDVGKDLLLAMLNPFLLRARHRDKRPKSPFIPPAKVLLKPRPEDIPVNAYQYLIGLRHLARSWNLCLIEELQWFLASMRGELPVNKKNLKNYSILHITLPPKQYFLALEVLTTRLGVKI